MKDEGPGSAVGAAPAPAGERLGWASSVGTQPAAADTAAGALASFVAAGRPAASRLIRPISRLAASGWLVAEAAPGRRLEDGADSRVHSR